MKKEVEIIAKAAMKAKAQVRNNTSMKDRAAILKKELIEAGISENRIKDEGAVPSRGAAFSVKEMKRHYRINYRCGYGRWNYAPCLSVKKK
jgi:hypothetical protein